MAIQATSAPSERVFSIASRCISKHRASLDPKVAALLLYLYDNWDKWEEELNFLQLAISRLSDIE